MGSNPQPFYPILILSGMSLKQYYIKIVGDGISEKYPVDGLDIAIAKSKRMIARLGPGFMARVYNPKWKLIGWVKYHTDGIQIFYYPIKHPHFAYVIRHDGKHNLKAWLG